MNELKDKLIRRVSELSGREYWGRVAGSSPGSIVSLRLGDKIPRDEVINNPHLSDDVRKYEAEYCLFIECVWRLDSDDGIICGAWDDNARGGPMLRGLDMLVGKRVERVEVLEPAFDLVITFSGGLRLRAC